MKVGMLMGSALKAIGEGKVGAVPAKAYWWLSGKKTYIGIILGALAGAVAAAGQAGYEVGELTKWLGYASAAVLALGQVDGATRVDPPGKPADVR